MGELIKREGASNPLAFSGERLTSAISGQVEVEHYHRYLLARDFCRGKDVLDVASGEGYGTAFLAQVARSAIGIEIDPASVEAARREFPNPILRFEHGDARALPLETATIDVAVSFETLEHLAEQDQFLAELRRVLRPDGLLILSTPDRDVYSPLNQPPNPYHVLELTRPEFETLVRNHFPIAAFTRQRALIGSIIAGASDNSPIRTFERRGDYLIEASQHLARAPYLLAFASAVPLPPIPDSVYVHRSDIDTDQQERSQAEATRKTSDQRAHDAEAAALRANADAADMDARRLDAERRIDAALAQATHYKAQSAETRTRLERTERTLVTLDQRTATAETDAARQRARADDLDAQLAAARTTISTLEHRVVHVATSWHTTIAALHDANEQLRAIHASTLWRATQPVRAIGARHPGLARILGRALKVAYWTASLQLPYRYQLWRNARQLRLAPPETAPTITLLSTAIALPAPEPTSIRLQTVRNPDVSIIVCTYGQVAHTLACLRAIADHPPKATIELLLVDDAYPGPNVATPEDLTPLQAVEGITLLRNPTNLGFLLSCNRGARAARGRHLYFLNNDAEPRPGAIDALADLLDSRADAGLVGSKLLYPDGRLQEAGGIVWDDASGCNYGRNENPARSDFNYVREVDYCSGASIMVPRPLFESLGGFDESFAPAYYEDTDLAFRIRAAGKKVLYEPRSEVVHHEGASHGTDTSIGVKAHQVTNKARMLERWAPTLARDSYPNSQHVLRARDRARHRRTILVVDHYTPEPDRDAGSRTMLNVLECLLDAGWVVKFWPSNRLYSATYTPPLEHLGIEVLDSRWPGDLFLWLHTYGADLDHLMVSRPDIAADIMHQLMRSSTGAVFSFYGHDLHFARFRRQADIQQKPELLVDATRMEQLERRVWRNFDVAIYLSEEEAETVRTISPGTLACSVVPYAFDITPPRTSTPHETRAILFVAGFAHPPNVDAAVFLMQEIIPRLEQEIGPVRITLAGSNPCPAVKELAGSHVEVTGWLSDEALAALYATHRVAIVPLRFGAGVKGKVVEALSHGLPLVTTTTGAQGIEGLDALVPIHDDVEGIVAALQTLLTDDQAWLAQSNAQTVFARTRFSREAMRHSIIAALEAGEQARLPSPLPSRERPGERGMSAAPNPPGTIVLPTPETAAPPCATAP